MLVLVLGLAVFFAAHLFTMWRAPRAALMARWGGGPYRIGYSLVSALGLFLIIWGFGRYRAAGMIPLWDPPLWTRHLALVLMIPAMILLVATYAPGEIKRRARHPMLAAITIWAFAHLIANGDLGSLVLFGLFLGWAVVARIAAERRVDAPTPVAPGGRTGDTVAVGAGLAAYVLFATYLHPALIGVPVVPG